MKNRIPKDSDKDINNDLSTELLNGLVTHIDELGPTGWTLINSLLAAGAEPDCGADCCEQGEDLH